MPFNVGDPAWIYLSGHKGNLTEGKVIAILNLPGYSFPHYVVEIPTSIEPLLEIRSGPMDMFKEDINAC